MKKIKITKQLKRTLKKYYERFSKVETLYYATVGNLEKQMEKETGIKGIEFFYCDGELAGIGTPSTPERMKLIHRSQLEK